MNRGQVQVESDEVCWDSHKKVVRKAQEAKFVVVLPDQAYATWHLSSVILCLDNDQTQSNPKYILM